MSEHGLDNKPEPKMGLPDRLLKKLCSKHNLDFDFLSEERAKDYRSQDYSGGLGDSMIKEDVDKLIQVLKTVNSRMVRVAILTLLFVTEYSKSKGKPLETYKFKVAENASERLSELE